MILKNKKFLFGTSGFVVIGCAMTLTTLLLQSSDTSSPKSSIVTTYDLQSQKSKTDVGPSGSEPIVWENEKAKFRDFTSTQVASTLPISMITPSSKNVIGDFTDLPGFEMPILDRRILLEKVVVTTALNSNWKVVYTITLLDDSTNRTATKNVTVTFAPSQPINWRDEMGIFENFETRETINTMPRSLRRSSEVNVKPTFDQISNFKLTDNRLEIAKVTVKTAFDTTSRQVELTLTFTERGTNNSQTKDVVVTAAPSKRFDFNQELEKYQSPLKSTLVASAIAPELKTQGTTNIKDKFIKFFGQILPNNVDDRLELTKVVVKESLNTSGRVSFTLTFTERGTNSTRILVLDIILDVDWTLEKTKFSDLKSSNLANRLAPNLKIQGVTDIKDDFLNTIYYRLPLDLDKRLNLTKVVVKTSFDPTSRTVVYTLTLSSFTTAYTTDVVVTFEKPVEWELEKTKFRDFTSPQTVNRISATLRGESYSSNILDEFTSISGYVAPTNLNSRLSLEKVVVKTPLVTATRVVVFTLTVLEEDSDSTAYTTDVTVTFAPSPPLDWEGEKQRIRQLNSDTTLINLRRILVYKQEGRKVNVANELWDIFEKAQLDNRLEPTKAFLKTPLNPTTRQVGYEVTLQEIGTKNQQTTEITITYAEGEAIIWEEEKGQFSNFASSETVNTLPRSLRTAGQTNVRDAFIALLEDNEHQYLDVRVELAKVIVKTSLNLQTRQVTYTLTLQEIGTTNQQTKDVTVTLRESQSVQWESEKLKFFNFRSPQLASAVLANLKTTSRTNIKNQFISVLGYPMPINLDDRLELTRVVVTQSLSNSGEVQYELSLNERGQSRNEVVVVVINFKLDWEQEKAKFSNFISNQVAETLAPNLKIVGDTNIRSDFVNLDGFVMPSSLDRRISLTKVVVKTALDPSTNSVVYKLTLTEESTKEKQTTDVTVSFARPIDWDREKARFQDFTASREIPDWYGTKGRIIEGNDWTNNIDYAIPSDLDRRLSINRVVIKTNFNDKTGQVVYTLFLREGNTSNEQATDVTITFVLPLVWEIEKARFSDFNAPQVVATLPPNLKTAGQTNIKDAFTTLPGYTAPSDLHKRLELTKVVVKTTLNPLARTVVYTLTLTERGTENSQSTDVTVTYAAPIAWALEKAKFRNFLSSRPANTLASNLKTASQTNIKEAFITLPGYIAPSDLDARLELTKVVVKTTLNPSVRTVVYTLTLTERGTETSQATDVTVTFGLGQPIRWTAEKAKFRNFASPQIVTTLAPNLKTASQTNIKEAFITLPGYDAPNDLDGRLELSKVVVKTALAATTRTVVYTLTLTERGTETSQATDVTVTFSPAIAWATEKAKFRDFASPQVVTTLTSDLKTPAQANIKEAFVAIPGYIAPNDLDKRLELTKVVVKTALNPSARTVVYTLTLAERGTETSQSTDVTITYATPIAWEVEKAKFRDFNSFQLVSALANNLKTASQTNIKTAFLALPGYIAPSDLDKRLELTKVVVQTALDVPTRTVVYKLTLTEVGTENKQTKDVTVTIGRNWQLELDKFQDFSSSELYSSLASELKQTAVSGANSNVKNAFAKVPGFAVPSDLDPLVSLREVTVLVADSSARQVTYKLTFRVGETGYQQTLTKSITVTYGLDWDANVRLFQNFVSSATTAELDPKLKALSNAVMTQDIKALFITIPGYSRPALSTGVTIKRIVVKTALNETTRAVVYAITLTDGVTDRTLSLTATYKPDFEIERAKFSDFSSTFGTYKAIALAKARSEVTEMFLAINGYVTPPNLASGVKVARVVVQTPLVRTTRKVVYAITLSDGQNVDSNTRTVTVTFASDLEASANTLTNFLTTATTSSKPAQLQAGSMNVKTSFMAIPGFKVPVLPKDIKITKVVVKEPLVAFSRVVKFTVTLTRDDLVDPTDVATTITQDVTVTFSPDLEHEAKKFTNFETSDDVQSETAQLARGPNDVKAKFVSLKNFTLPPLTRNVTISKVVVTKPLDAKQNVVFRLTLSFNGKTIDKDVIVTFQSVSPAPSSGLSTGVIAGIALGGLAGGGLLGYLIYYLLKRRK